MTDKWKIAYLLVIAVTIQLNHNVIYAEETNSIIVGDNLDGPNVCKKIDKYNVTVVVTETVPYQETKMEWCAQFPPRCKKTHLRFKQVDRTEVLEKTRAIRECCEGYKENEERNRCIPHCQKNCGNGKCVAPNTCKCESGFGGPECNITCPPKFYGSKCKNKCDCANEANCDPYNGKCICPKGYQGEKCQNTCTPDRYGEGCQEICRCENSGKCDHISGECYCAKGFTGPLCEEKCRSGKNGDECKSVCRCQNGGICDENSQKCKCPPGWIGSVCGNRCQPGFYGLNCKKVCECFNGASCDPVSGKCICEPGFVGEKCLDQCPFDKYGEGCQHQCNCSNGATCDFATGICHCALGFTGADCSERLCPDNRYGENCNETCECEVDNTETCHPFDGSCECKPGFSGALCNRPCPFLKYGKGCGFQCDCKNNAQCVPTNGTCICSEGFTGSDCSEKCPNGTYGQNCSQRCECKNGAECSPETGQCFCKAGWSGLKCERPCEVNKYGQGCSEKCDCLNNGACSPITGECYCAPGYTGKQCEKRCDAWTFGQNCSFECNCEVANTLACDHISGRCLCKTEYNGGQTIKYAGVKCESKCPVGYYGDDCQHQCNCKNNSSCDPVTGECFCERGWIGQKCDQVCPNGYYGQNCKEKCPENMPAKTTCDHVTGEFKCRAGYIGLTCDHPCPKNSYGEECKYTCKCDHGECHHVNGHCACYPGFSGEFCDQVCPNNTWGSNCQHQCNCLNNAQCRKSDGVCVCEKGFFGTRCEEVCPEGYYGEQCLQTCTCNRRPNFICHPADGCVCKSGFTGKNCDESAYLANTTDPNDDYIYTDNFDSTTFDNISTEISTVSSSLESHSTAGSLSVTLIPVENRTPKSLTMSPIDISTSFTFATLSSSQNFNSETSLISEDEITTKFTFAPLHPTHTTKFENITELMSFETTEATNHKTTIYAHDFASRKEIFVTEATTKKEELIINLPYTTQSNKESSTNAVTMKNIMTILSRTTEADNTTIESSRNNEETNLFDEDVDMLKTTPNVQQTIDKLWPSINTITTEEIESHSKINAEWSDSFNFIKSTTEGRKPNTGLIEQSFSENENSREKNISDLETTTTVWQMNVTSELNTIMSNDYLTATSRFEYLNNRNNSEEEVNAYENENISINKTQSKDIIHDLLINKTDSNVTEQMELKRYDDENNEGSSVSRSGMIWGIFCTLLFVGIIMAVLLYYRRRVANLKAEIGHVVRYMSDDPRNFDNPVYQYQPSVNTDSLTLISRNGMMNNLRQTRPSHMDRLNNFDHDSNSSGRAAAYSLQYDSELMNQKNHDADSTNPNLYSSIDDHLYDEIKLKYADLDSEYDHLDYSRPQQPVSKHYHRATSSTMSQNSQRDRESNQSNNRQFPNHTDSTYDAPIPHPKKLNISVPPLPAKNNSNLTPSPSSSTASTVTQDDNIDAIISIEKPMHKDLNGKPDVMMNDTQTDSTKLEI